MAYSLNSVEICSAVRMNGLLSQSCCVLSLVFKFFKSYVLAMCLYIFVAFFIEKMIANRVVAILFHAANLSALLWISWELSIYLEASFGPTLVVALFASVLWLKLYSFAHVCYTLKASLDPELVKKSDNAYSPHADIRFLILS